MVSAPGPEVWVKVPINLQGAPAVAVESDMGLLNPIVRGAVPFPPHCILTGPVQ